MEAFSYSNIVFVETVLVLGEVLYKQDSEAKGVRSAFKIIEASLISSSRKF